MTLDSDLDAMTVACIDAGNLVMRLGSPELRAAMRAVLFILGRDIAQLETEQARQEWQADGERRVRDDGDHSE